MTRRLPRATIRRCANGAWGIGLLRRNFILALGGSAAVWPCGAQARLRKVGVLVGQPESDPETRARVKAFKHGLEALGWIEGRSIAFELRYAEGRLDRLPRMAGELLGANVDLIVAQGSVPVAAVHRLTNTVPIVMVSVGDAVGSGFVASLARPGGNVTGLVAASSELGAKRLEILKEALPAVARVAVLWNGHNASHNLQWRNTQATAWPLGLELRPFPVNSGGDVDQVLLALAQGGADALLTMDDALIQTHRHRIIAVATRHRVPVVGQFRMFALAGALLSYGPSLIHMWERAASYVDRILKGIRPADLPVEQPTKFDLIVNLKTAKALGIAIPQTLLVRAEDVIE